MEYPEQILRIIEELTAANGYPPTMREIGAQLGLQSTSHVLYYMRKLEQQGRIRWQPGQARTIQIIR